MSSHANIQPIRITHFFFLRTDHEGKQVVPFQICLSFCLITALMSRNVRNFEFAILTKSCNRVEDFGGFGNCHEVGEISSNYQEMCVQMQSD